MRGSKKGHYGMSGPFCGLFISLLLMVLSMAPSLSSGSWSEWRGDPLHLAEETGKIPEVGELIWSYQTGDQVLSSPVFSENGLLIGSDDGNMYCLDPDTGSLLWKFKTGSSIQATALIRDGKAYFGSFDRNLYCISLPETGSGGSASLVWNVTLKGQVLSSCHWYDGSVIVADNSGTLYRVNDEGEVLWENDLSEMDFWASPLIIEEEGRAFIGDIARHLWFIDLDDGSIVWNKTFGWGTEFYSSGTYRDGIYYTPGGMDELFYAIRASDGKVLWTFDCDNGAYSTPVIREDRIYFGSYGFLWCLPLEDPNEDGNISQDELIWSSDIHDYQGGSSPLIAGGKVFIGSDDWHIYCFDADSGDEIWGFEAKGYVYSSPSLYEEKIYFGSSDRSVYCIGKRPPGLSIEAVPEMKELTSDNITKISIIVTDDQGAPVSGSSVSFTTSAGFIAFDRDGNTRVDHITDDAGSLEVYYFPVQVSSRSTIDIDITVEKAGLRSSDLLLQVIVEPGEGGISSTDDVGKDVQKRVPYIAAIIALAVVNLILLLVVLVWFLRNRNENREAEK